MANIRDVYELDSKADTGGIDAGTAALKKQTAGVDDLGKKASGATSGIGKMLGALKSAGGAPLNALKSLGGALKDGIANLANFGRAMQAVQGIANGIGTLFTNLAGVSPEFAGEIEHIKTQVNGLRGLLLAPIASALTPVLKQVQDVLGSDAFIQFVQTIGPQIGTAFAQIAQAVLPLAVNLGGSLLPLLTTLISSVLPVVVQLIQAASPILLFLVNNVLGLLVSTVLPTVMQLLTVMLPIMAQVVDAVLPALMPILALIIESLGSLLTTLLPIVGTLAETFLPILLQLVGSLLPVLAPLFQAVAEVLVQVLTALAPVVQELLTALLPIIVNLIQTLLPPFTTLLLSVADVLVTLLQALGPVVVELVQGLAPVIGLVAQLMAENLVVAMNLLAAFVRDVLGPAIEWLSQNIISPLVGILQSVGGQIQIVVDALMEFHRSITSITLPDWLTPGSPTPFEMGLRGIADAMNAIPTNPLQIGVGVGGAAPAAVAGAAGGIVVNLTVNGPFGAGYTPEGAGRAAGDAFVKAARAQGVMV